VYGKRQESSNEDSMPSLSRALKAELSSRKRVSPTTSRTLTYAAFSLRSKDMAEFKQRLSIVLDVIIDVADGTITVPYS